MTIAEFFPLLSGIRSRFRIAFSALGYRNFKDIHGATVSKAGPV